MPKRKAQTAVPAVPKASLGARIKKDIIKNYQLYLLMIPGFLLLILFKIGPVGAMVIAFEDFSAAKGVFGSTWVGLDNFRRILQDPYIWKITQNTIILAFLSVVVVFPIPIIFALFLNEVRTKWVRNTVQSLSFLPYFISAAVMVSIMYTLLSPYIGSDQYPDHQAGRYFHKLYGKTGMVPAIVRDTGDLADVRLLGHYLYCCHDEH